MSTSKAKTKAQQVSEQEIQQTYSRFQNDLQTLAGKIGELEQEAEEHTLVLSTLHEALEEEPDRKCFRLIGGVLVERTVKDVVPALQTNRDGIKKVITTLTEQIKSKEQEFENFKLDHNIRVIHKSPDTSIVSILNSTIGMRDTLERRKQHL